MAKVVKIKSELKSNKNKAWLYTALAFLFMLVCIASGVGFLIAAELKKLNVPIALPIILMCFSIVPLAFYIINRKRFSILRSGVAGEKATLEILQKLPKNYTVITNPVIYNRGKVNELDFVVVGKNGVFIIEAKNYRGILSGKTSQQEWKQTKHGKNNKVYEKNFKNPVKQAHRQGRRMLEVFSDLDVTADVYPIVYFVDSKSVLKITNDADTDVAIINKENTLLNYIVKAEGRNTVSSSEYNKILRFFKK